VSGDVRVLGLVAGTHVLEDIGMDVPYGVTVSISAEKAARSKDLHRAISQRCIFALPSHPSGPAVFQQNQPQQVGDGVLLERIRALEEEKRLLQMAILQSNEAQQQKFDAILAAIQAQATVQRVVHVNGNGGNVTPSRHEVADGEAPTFIPSEIHPKDAESRIESQKDSAGASGVSDAAERLRKMRQGSGSQ